MKRKILALLLACMMVISMVPGTVFAESDVETDAAQEVSCTCATPGVPENENEVVTMPETCVSWGHMVYRCTECGLMRTELTKKPDETKHVDAVVDSETGEETLDHKCNNCGASMGGECVEGDGKDHKCDYCGTKRSDCKDEEPKNHKCDVCGEAYGDPHKAAEGKHTCAYCGGTLTTCLDENKDHECDVCGLAVDTGCVDVNPADHKCDYCEGTISKCVDKNSDHVCDICGVTTMGGECADTNPKDHECDYCGVKLSDCADTNQDHKCDYCGAEGMGNSCADTNRDHLCDYCGADITGGCSDTTPKNHECDYCGGKMGGDCADVTVKDHECDYCGKELSECKDYPAQQGGVLPTCTTEGYSEVNCGWCGTQLVAPTVLPKLEHTWGETYNAPTCERNGYWARWCKNEDCNAQETDWDKDTQLKHTPSDDLCVATQDCSVCGQEFTLPEDVLEDHKPSTATCKADQVCTVCGVKLADALEHTPSEALCKATQACSKCGEKFTLDPEDVVEHTFAETATCIERTCTKCGEKVKASTEHTWVEKDATDSTYDKEGWTGSKECKVCGKAEKVGEDIPVLDEKIGFSHTVTGLNGISCVAVGGKVIVTVSMAVGENGARVEALQWAMWFNPRMLNFEGGTFGLEGMDYSMSNVEFADEYGRVIITANVTSGAYKTFAEGEYAFATLVFEVKDGVRVGAELDFEIDRDFLKFTRLDSFRNTLTVTTPEQPQKITVTNVLGNAVDGGYASYVVDVNDLAALLRAMKPSVSQEDLYKTYWMCDVDQNGDIDADDLIALRALIVSSVTPV